MLISHSLQLFALNVAIASVLCMMIALALSKVFQSLPKRYATLMVGMFACLLAPLVVMLGTVCSLGQLPIAASIDNGVLSVPLSNGATHEQSIDAPTAPQIDVPVVNELIDNVALSSIVETAPIANSLPVSKTETQTPLDKLFGSGSIILWLSGVVALALLYARKLWLCRSFLSTCRPIADSHIQLEFERLTKHLGISNSVRLLESDILPTPIVVGLLRASVILPADIGLSLTSDQLASVLTHELSHIARKDHWTAAVQTIARIVYWWNPLIHWASRRAGELREMICDDIATSSDIAPEQYARTIIQMAERTAAARELVGSLGISLSPISELERRLRRIIAEKSQMADLRISKRFVSLLFVLSLVLATGLLFAQVPQAESPSVQHPSQDEVQNALPQLETSSPISADQSKPASASNQPTGATKSTPRPRSITGTVIDTRGMPVANADVIFQANLKRPEIKHVTNAEGQFKIALDINLSHLHSVRLRAYSPDGRVGYYRFRSTDPNPIYENIEILVEELRDVSLQVIDAVGSPISNANVSFQLSFPYIIGPLTTNAQGKVTGRAPHSEKILAALAWKDGQGLDYRAYVDNLDGGSIESRALTSFAEGKTEVLTLEGATPLRVRVIDRQTHPLSNSSAHVWLLKKPDQSQRLNLSMFYDSFNQKADADGSVSFDWFPKWQQDEVQVLAEAEGYLAERVYFDPKLHDYAMIAAMRPAVRFHGDVSLSNGRPASNILVTANIQGGYSTPFTSGSKPRQNINPPSFGYRGLETHFAVQTDPNGHYDVAVEADRTYSLSTSNDHWIAPTLGNIKTQKGQSDLQFDLVLKPTTRLHGKLLSKASGKPISDMVVLKQIGVRDSTDFAARSDANAVAVIAMPEKKASSDGHAEFQFYVGDGDYELSIPDDTTVQRVSVNGEAELIVNLYTSKRDLVELTGMVLFDSDDRAASEANILGASRNLANGRDWNTVADTEGRFSTQRLTEAAYVLALSHDGHLGAITNVSAHTQKIEMRLLPLGTVTGRLISREHSEPIADQTIEYGIKIQAERGGGHKYRFGGTVKTAANGEFKITGLVPHWQYQIMMQDTINRNLVKLPITDVISDPGQQFDLGDVLRPPTPNFRPYTGSENLFPVQKKEAEPVEK